MSKNPEVTIKMEDGGAIRLELLPEYAKNTVDNFLSLAQSGFYNGLIFHRVIEGFMIQGGCPKGDGTGGAGYHIRGEFSGNGIKNELNHARGVISMARASHPDSASSQFFIMHKDAPHLDGQYAAFGRVVEGMDTVDKIAASAVDYSDRPVKKQIIASVSTELFDYDVKEPEKL